MSHCLSFKPPDVRSFRSLNTLLLIFDIVLRYFYFMVPAFSLRVPRLATIRSGKLVGPNLTSLNTPVADPGGSADSDSHEGLSKELHLWSTDLA